MRTDSDGFQGPKYGNRQPSIQTSCKAQLVKLFVNGAPVHIQSSQAREAGLTVEGEVDGNDVLVAELLELLHSRAAHLQLRRLDVAAQAEIEGKTNT